MANNAFVNMFKVKELRDRLFFTFFILAVFRLGCVLTIPGINAALLVQYFNSYAESAESAFASYMDFFAGGQPPRIPSALEIRGGTAVVR